MTININTAASSVEGGSKLFALSPKNRNDDRLERFELHRPFVKYKISKYPVVAHPVADGNDTYSCAFFLNDI